MRRALLPILLLLWPAFGRAQPPVARGAPFPRPGAAARPLPAPVLSPGPSAALPPPPKVSDPMLAPVPPPTRLLRSWQEALSYLRARSTDLRIALDQVLQAEAQTRVAFAAYLPSINATGIATHNFLT